MFNPHDLGSAARRALLDLESGVWLQERTGWRVPGRQLITRATAKSLINVRFAKEMGNRLCLTQDGQIACDMINKRKAERKAS